MLTRRVLLPVGTILVVTLAAVAVLWPPTGRTTATSENSITSPDTGGDAHLPSLALDGEPVVTYYDEANTRMKVLRCNDPDCAGGDESITSPDPGEDVGIFSDVELNTSGNPVVSYYDDPNGQLKIMRCNDTNCSGDDESITSPATGFDAGWPNSLKLDLGDNPVVSYYDMANDDLKVLHCNDPMCSGGDESITAPDTGGDVGWGISLALDDIGNPVISYYDVTNGDLKVLHCNDPDCIGGDESITSPDTGGDVGRYSSLALGASGNPVVSYYDVTNSDLKVLHCNDPDCIGGDESITSPDTGGDVGTASSLVLDASSRPVVAYRDRTNENLKVLHCGNADCTAGNTITSPDTAGISLALELDDEGYPVVSYAAVTHDLKILHCGDPYCTTAVTPTDFDGDKCPDADENGPDEMFGGQRDYKNPWDYFNPTGDGQNRVDDILAVVNNYFLDVNDPDAYAAAGHLYDRTLQGPNAWNLGPPNGQIRVDDILHSVNSYFHDCGAPTATPTPTPTP